MEALTAAEVSGLFDLDERRIRKDVEHGVFGAMPGGPRFELPALVYFRLIVELRLDVGVEGRKRLYKVVESSSATKEWPETIALSRFVVVRFRSVVRDVQARVKRFEAWKRKLVEDPNILGGEPVFPKSRLAVRNVGGMLLRGAPAEEIHEDYPYLTDEDIEFARRYTIAYPRMGRPRESEAPSG
jgi:uncharacterized protein (DUF433 family)